jgi:hypothetical protein
MRGLAQEHDPRVADPLQERAHLGLFDILEALGGLPQEPPGAR